MNKHAVLDMAIEIDKSDRPARDWFLSRSYDQRLIIFDWIKSNPAPDDWTGTKVEWAFLELGVKEIKLDPPRIITR